MGTHGVALKILIKDEVYQVLVRTINIHGFRRFHSINVQLVADPPEYKTSNVSARIRGPAHENFTIQ